MHQEDVSTIHLGSVDLLGYEKVFRHQDFDVSLFRDAKSQATTMASTTRLFTGAAFCHPWP